MSDMRARGEVASPVMRIAVAPLLLRRVKYFFKALGLA